MKTVAIITEYNPFHNGHQYQIDRVREIFGADTAIIAIMSSCFTQRGEAAIADKGIRSRAAVDCGVNLVLELPFPYSAASAEFFASAGVHIASRLRVVDYLVFGTEANGLEELYEIAEGFLSPELDSKLEALRADEDNGTLGYPALLCKAYYEIFGKDISALASSPNNILAIEYIKALLRTASTVKPYAIKREGAGYDDEMLVGESLQSASAIRNELKNSAYSALDYVPDSAKTIYLKAIAEGKMPSDIARLDTAFISHFRLNPSNTRLDFHDSNGGLYNRILDKSRDAESISSLTAAASTKKYTTARIRRAILFSYFGVTSSEVRTMPEYTQVLAADTVGCALLKRIKKMSDFCILTKPSSVGLSGLALKQQELSAKAESVYGMTLKNPNSGRFPFIFTPYVKKER